MFGLKRGRPCAGRVYLSVARDAPARYNGRVTPATRSLLRLLTLGMAALLATLGWGRREVSSDRFRIVGPSMAPTLSGTRCFRVTCADCGFPFACDALSPPDRNLAICPNCGYTENAAPPESEQPGERVRVDARAFDQRAPRRWDVVALQSPDDSGQYSVKRIAGLPGEHISIMEGDVFADGHLCRKSLVELRAVAVTVHDDRFRPAKTGGLPARWRGESAETRWRTTPEGYAGDAARADGELDWLAYHQWPCMASHLPRTQEVPVFDNDSYNQGAARGTLLQDVQDLFLSCLVTTSGRGSLALRLHDGREWLHVEMWPDQGQAVLRRGANELARARLAAHSFWRSTRVEFAHCDGRALLAIGGELVLAHSLAPSPEKFHPVANPIGIGTAGMTVQARDVRVLRDVHYLDPQSTGRAWIDERRLKAGEYFVLGDNAPVSVDSRFWKTGSVRRKTLLGKVRFPAGS